MKSSPDIAKLIRIALCFFGVLAILSGMTTGLQQLESRVFPGGNLTTFEYVRYWAGVALFCPLVFVEVFLGLLIIRYNARIVDFLERCSRTKSRRGKKHWKRWETHACLVATLGVYLLYSGGVSVLNYSGMFVQLFCTQPEHVKQLLADATGMFLAVLFLLFMLLLMFMPGLLLMRFARCLTGWIDKKFLMR